jgi:hypothetical protein
MHTPNRRRIPSRRPNLTARAAAAVAAGTVFAAAGTALAAQPAAGSHFKGTTAQGKAISFRVAPTGKHLVKFKFYLTTACHPGHSFVSSGGHEPSKTTSSVKANGRFSIKIALPWHHYAGGYTAKGTVTLTGTFKTPSSATGRLKGVVDYTTGSQCSASTRFTATG